MPLDITYTGTEKLINVKIKFDSNAITKNIPETTFMLAEFLEPSKLQPKVIIDEMDKNRKAPPVKSC